MNSDLKKVKARLAIKLGYLHRKTMKENLPLIIIFKGDYTDEEKNLLILYSAYLNIRTHLYILIEMYIRLLKINTINY
jgi:hypothetical protein